MTSVETDEPSQGKRSVTHKQTLKYGINYLSGKGIQISNCTTCNKQSSKRPLPH